MALALILAAALVPSAAGATTDLTRTFHPAADAPPQTS